MFIQKNVVRGKSSSVAAKFVENFRVKTQVLLKLWGGAKVVENLQDSLAENWRKFWKIYKF